jgi:hypothetical protein
MGSTCIEKGLASMCTFAIVKLETIALMLKFTPGPINGEVHLFEKSIVSHHDVVCEGIDWGSRFCARTLARALILHLVLLDAF